MRKLFATVALTLCCADLALAATPLTTCGETVGDAVLVGDLDCTAGTGFAVTLSPGGVLDLAGHRLTGPSDYGTFPDNLKLSGGVFCQGDCTIVGNGGTLAGPELTVERPYFSTGVYQRAPRRVHTSCVACDSGSNAPLTMTITNTIISGWPNNGVQGRTVIIEDSTIDGNHQTGVGSWDDVLMTNCTVTNNGYFGLHSTTAEVHDSTFTGNNTGMYANKKFKLFGTSITDSERYAFMGSKLILESSSLVDNCTVGTAGGACSDIITRRRPKLSDDSTCESSLRSETGPPDPTWSICLDDNN